VSIEELLEAKRAGRLTSASIVTDLAIRANLWTKLEELFPVVDRDREDASTLPRHRLRRSRKKRSRCSANRCAHSRIWRASTGMRSAARGVASPADWNHLRRMLSTD
jgi:hypothetical protein